MKSDEKRRQYSAEQKYKIVKEALTTDQQVTEVCRKYGVGVSLFYKWQEQFLSGARSGLERGKTSPSSLELRKLESLEKDNTRMKDVIAEITAENIEFKKKFSI